MERVSSEDGANGTALALKAKTLGGGIFNVTMGVLASSEDFADALKTVVPGAKVRIETPPATAVSMPHMRGVSDLSLAKNLLGYAPRYGLVDALRDLADWMRPRNRV
jgi:nucleoside-diphosphate-sugar epimerase